MNIRLFSFLTQHTLLRIVSGVMSLALILTPLLVDAAQSTSACATWTSFLTTPFCWMNSLFAYIGATIMSLGAFFLGIAGMILDNVVYYGIVNFGVHYNLIKPGVEQVWTIIRDFANIGIIGAFVFVAISTILSIDQYSVKNFVAKLLIAAVLINFSLFFTKTAFDVSNMTATVFANAIGATNATGGVMLSATGSTQTGFAGAFLQALGLSSAFDVGALKRAGEAANFSLMALIVGLLIFFLLMLTAIVFMYASFLLLTRVVIIIFLLMVSAGAFAARAIPSMGSYWDDWKKQLMHSAFFAPLLMMFLWAVMVVAKQLAPTNTQNLADMIVQTVSSGQGMVSFQILFNFGVIIGLLIVAIKSAGKVADYTATYAQFKTGTKKGMGYLDRGVGILKGTPKGAWNAWDYRASKNADERVRSKDWQPNGFQRGLASARGMLSGALFGKDHGAAVERAMRMKMAQNKRDRLIRQAEGGAGFSQPLVEMKESVDFVKKVLTKGVPEGGAKKIRENAAKESTQVEDKGLKAQAAPTDKEQQERFFNKLNEQIRDALDDTNIGHVIEAGIKDGFKAAHNEQMAAVQKIREHEAKLADTRDARERTRLQEQISEQKQREQVALRQMEKHRQIIMQDGAMRKKFNAEALQDINKTAQKGHSMNDNIGGLISEQFDGDPWKMQAVRARFGKAQKEESVKDNLASLPEVITKLTEEVKDLKANVHKQESTTNSSQK